MKFTQESPWTEGEQKFEGRLGMAQSSLMQLEYYLKHQTSSKPKELAWEVKFMQWVVRGGETRAAKYFDARYTKDFIPRERRVIAAELGYKVK